MAPREGQREVHGCGVSARGELPDNSQMLGACCPHPAASMYGIKGSRSATCLRGDSPRADQALLSLDEDNLRPPPTSGVTHGAQEPKPVLGKEPHVLGCLRAQTQGSMCGAGPGQRGLLTLTSGSF